MKARIVIDDVHPCTPNRYPAKASVSERVPVSADIFKDGHDYLLARVRWRKNGSERWTGSAPLTQGLNDHWTGDLAAEELGMHDFVVEAWTDVYGTWRHKIEVKLEAGQDVSSELSEGVALFERRAKEAKGDTKERLERVAQMLGDSSLDYTARVASAATDEVAALLVNPGKSDDVSVSRIMPLWVDRERAQFGSWYEVFPRSFGGFKGVIEALPYVRRMNFDVLYLPPVHPIGTSFRKGKNNTLDPTPDDVGSPWAIGNEDGGHTAIHADLGTIDDFDDLVRGAKELGIEVAMDYALQCSPDHPWVRDHPEWFIRRPDGSIAYAENPPKKYQDIFPINFWPDSEKDRVALWNACKEILDYWIDHGVRIFRVDNPHTKPLAFWGWLIPALQSEHPDLVFLAEAFTKPKMMAKLAEVGFSQSYSYFTWRNDKHQLTEYGVEVATGQQVDYMRPNFWPNTPDILGHDLRNAPLSSFRSRLFLAATMVPSYGIYSGFELGENEPASEKNEEYLNSEKYEIRSRNYDTEWSLAPLIGQINDIRRRHPALQQIRNIWFHGAANDNVICYSKRNSTGSDTVIVVVNLDPYAAQECVLSLNLEELGVGWEQPYQVFDEVTQRPFHWWGAHPYVALTPEMPAHILHVRHEQ